MSSDLVGQVLEDFRALRRSQDAADPELQAIQAAILLEDLFDVTLSDVEIDPALLADPSAVAAMVDRLRGTV